MEALDELLPLATHWRTIGALLGVQHHILERINKVEAGAHEHLQAMLSEWVKQIYPPPTWVALADAVGEVDTQRAQKIREQHHIPKTVVLDYASIQ